MTALPQPTSAAALPKGQVVLTTYGMLTGETHGCLMEMRSFTEKQGLYVDWPTITGALVERSRDQAAANLLQTQGQWLLFVDGDCVFNPDALLRLLNFAYVEMPSCDIVGAYNPLRPEPHLPTIDTGTGTWESHLPFSGPMPVMRTGSAFILLKRHVFERVEAPWYGTRNPMRPIDALHDVDNWALQRFDGVNPLREHPAWDTLVKCARDDNSSRQPTNALSFTGEDSSLCDRARMAGLVIFVHSDVECKHVDRKIITAEDHVKVLDNSKRMRRAMVGVLGS